MNIDVRNRSVCFSPGRNVTHHVQVVNDRCQRTARFAYVWNVGRIESCFYSINERSVEYRSLSLNLSHQY